jgi:RecA/RadA recombinase
MLARNTIIEDLKNYYTDIEFKNLSHYSYDEINDNDLISFYNNHCDTHAIEVSVSELSEKYKDILFLMSTPDGYQDVNDLYIKGPFENFYVIKTTSNNIECAEQHYIETNNGWKYVNELKIGDNILTINGYQPVIDIIVNKRNELAYDWEIDHTNHRYWAGSGISNHNTGKTFLACSCAREAQHMGYTVIYMDSEGAIDAKFVSRLGVDPEKLIIKQVSTIAETSQFIANICKSLQEQEDNYGTHQKVMFVLDSLGNLTSDKERDDTMSGNNKRDMTKAQELKALFRVNATPLARLQVPLVCNNHSYATIGSYIPGQTMSGGTGLVYNSSVTIELSAAKLEDKENDKAAAAKTGSEAGTKTGVLITAKPVKSRFCRPMKVKFQIPYYKKPNPYAGLEQFMSWENSGVCRGNVLSEKEYLKLSESDKKKVYPFEFNGETRYCLPKDTARGIVVKHLGEAVPIIDFFTDRVFTPEFLQYLNENVIKPMFSLPDQSAFDDIKDIEESLELGDDIGSEAIIQSTNTASPAVDNPTTEV